MADASLAEQDVADGKRLLEQLDQEGLHPKAAFWLYRPDTDRWRLIIGTDEAKRGSGDLYRRIIAMGPDVDPSIVEFQTTDSPFIKAISKLIHVEGIAEIRMRNNLFDGVYIEDALIYRMAA